MLKEPLFVQGFFLDLDLTDKGLAENGFWGKGDIGVR